MLNIIKKISLIILGLLLSLILLEAGLQTVDFVISIQRKKINHEFKTNDIKILCIGESTTYQQWPIQLEQYLKNNSSKTFKIIDGGLPSIGIEDILSRVDKQINLYHPDIVITMMGINNATFEKNGDKQIYKKHNLKTVELIYLIKKHLLSKSQAYADNDIEQNESYYLKLVDKYSKTKDKPIELINIIKRQPNNVLAFSNLIYLYGVYRNDIENMDKYINLFYKYNPNKIYFKIVITQCSTYINNKKYSLAKKLIANLISNKDINTDFLNEFFKNAIVIKDVPIKDLTDIYNLMVTNKVQACLIISIYEYLVSNNININYPDYEIKYLRTPNFNTEIIKNSYIKFAQKLADKNIIYICMGYPTIPIGEFKSLFDNTNLKDKIIFISNENNFKDKLKTMSYYELFADNFGGTFGHCTYLGNSMIAENLVKTIEQITQSKKSSQ